MSEETQQDDMSKKVVAYVMPGMDAVTVRRDVAYASADAGDLAMDIYYPPEVDSSVRLPVVIIVAGYRDPGYESVVGCKFKEMGATVSWARLAAASGLIAIAYTNVDPSADVHTLIQYLRENAAALGIDENRLSVWSSSGNVPTALSVLMHDGSEYLKCAVLCYGFMLDLDGSSAVAEASKTFGFVNASAGKSVDDLPQDLPLFIVRAGQDSFEGLNEAIDGFVGKGLARNLPITLVNNADGPHAFDLMDDCENTRGIVKQILAFMQHHLLA